MNYKLYLLHKRLNKFRYMLCCAVGFDHIRWLKKHEIFAGIGEKCFFQPNRLQMSLN